MRNLGQDNSVRKDDSSESEDGAFELVKDELEDFPSE